ncbi:MAG: RodZ domain-containing protein [Cyanobacteria bacterium J06642_11]
MISYSTVQKQQLSQLGAYLQEKRQEQGKSLEDISLQTYIRAQLLKAVESGDTTDLPQPIFVQGFIRRYADALGLDGSNFAKQFPVHSIPNTPRPTPRPATQINIPVGKEPAQPQTLAQVNANKPKDTALGETLPVQKAPPKSVPTTPKSVPTTPKSVPTPPKPLGEVSSVATDIEESLELSPTPMGDDKLHALGFSKPPGDELTIPQSPGTRPEPEAASPSSVAVGLEQKPTTSWAPSEEETSSSRGGAAAPWMSWLPWGIGAAVAVGAIALIVPRLMGNGSEQPTEPVQAEAPTTEEITPAETAIPATSPDPEPESISSAPVSVQVEVTEAGPSWMSVNVDGEVVFEGTVPPGTKELWEGQSTITLNVGNAGAALISANGNEPTPAGDPGGVAFLNFSTEGE